MVSLPSVIVVYRFDAPTPAFQAELEQLLATFAGCRPGFVRGRLGRATDDPSAWVLADASGTVPGRIAAPFRRTR